MAKQPTLKVSLLHVNALVHAVNSFPLNTPKRWSLISHLVNEVDAKDAQSSCVVVCEQDSNSSNTTIDVHPAFDCSEAHCKQLYTMLMDTSPTIFEQCETLSKALFKDCTPSGFKPLVLLPGKVECCGKKVWIRNRPSFPIVYTTQGTLVAASYNATCTQCKCTIHHSSWSPHNDEKEEFFFKPKKYVQVTNKTVFETQLLNQLTYQMALSGATFESQTDIYNTIHGEQDALRLSSFASSFSRIENPASFPWKLNEKRYEDGWFLYQLIVYYDAANCLSTTDLRSQLTEGNRRDLEQLCECANLHTSQSSPKWVHHICSMKGCKEGFAVVDGNEKINRSVCAAPRRRVKIPTEHIFMTSMCTRSPINGGRHRKPSKFCQQHVFLEDEEEDDTIESDPSQTLPTPHTPSHLMSRHQVGNLPENDDPALLVGCRKERGVNRFHDRTAGILSLVRPCGIIVNSCEMYTCESPTQVYLFLINTFARGSDIERLHYLGYDRACDLHPFLCNLERKGAYFAKWLLRKVNFLVDSFHVAHHTEKCCMPPDNPDCKYHPQLPCFNEIHGTNTECAEQSFRWLNRLKMSMKQMQQHKFNFFLKVMSNTRNLHLERTLREKKLM